MRYMVAVVFALLTCGCGVLGTEGGRVNGYLLHREAMRVGPSEGYMFVQFVPDDSVGMDGRITGRMHTAIPLPTEEGMPSVRFTTSDLTGTINGTDVIIQEEQLAPGVVGNFYYVDYSGTLEGDEMRLTTDVQGVLTAWEGEEATLEDFGAAAEELATEGD